MSQTLNATETADCADDEMDVDSDLLFVRFYQRSGNVGIWGFSDGCVQLHFPDHTKFVLSADGLHTSATLVPVEGVRAIEEKHDLPTKLLRDRQTLVHSIHALLYGSQPGGRGRKLFADMVQANMVEEKLYLLLQILDQWISGGGLGCTGVGEERLQWQGSWVNEHARKIDWVTVGRLGGDEVRS
ncbi:Pkinase-domain-containing protein, partial [Aureobasidium melanogenum]